MKPKGDGLATSHCINPEGNSDGVLDSSNPNQFDLSTPQNGRLGPNLEDQIKSDSGNGIISDSERYKDFLKSETTCSCCHTNKTRILVGVSPNKKRRYYVDKFGDHWQGKKCPECRRAHHAEYMRRRRKSDKTGEPMEYKKRNGSRPSLDQLFAIIKKD